MMDSIAGLQLGFSHALTLTNLGWALLGCFLGVRLHRRSFASQLELRPWSKILHVVFLIKAARQRLSTDIDLAAGRHQRRTNASR